jgi:hypothetical protein
MDADAKTTKIPSSASCRAIVTLTKQTNNNLFNRIATTLHKPTGALTMTAWKKINTTEQINSKINKS